MDEWFTKFYERRTLPAPAAEELMERGYVVLPGPIPAESIPKLQSSYDAAVASAAEADVGRGRASIRVNDFVNRGPEFDLIYAWPPALEACVRVIERPFRLSAMHARTLPSGGSAQELHTDVPRTSDAWPMLGLILMVDGFGTENGATRFVPGSHRWTQSPGVSLRDPHAPHPDEVLACGAEGSVILFNTSTWHGHTANISPAPRRSLQATFIPREGKPATDFAARMRPETYARIGPIARYVIGVGSAPGAPPA
ncbi:MAG: phytanoyl-CoA dioxygenase family protein [Gemmatimonadota bacterium]